MAGMLVVVVLIVVAISRSGTAGRWRPSPADTWQWQLSDLPVDVSVDAHVFDIDLFDADAELVATLHASGRRAVCYLSAGTFEGWRPDAALLRDDLRGRALDEPFGDERWLDIRQLSMLRPVMEARLDLCRSKGFDAVEPDNVDGYANDTGFPLTAEDQLTYNRFLADASHARGLSVALKNDLGQVDELVEWFDFAVNEECATYDECELLGPFAEAGKAVFHVEYDLELSDFCDETTALGFSSMRKGIELDAGRAPCP
jgi:hypothetical protein